jgi:hypothetical protein
MAKPKKTSTTAPVVENKVEAAPAAEATTTTTVEPVQLTIADLQLLARIVDLASRRGAFQAGELSQVGDAYNKLAGFLTYVESVQKKEEAEKAAEAPAA